MLGWRILQGIQDKFGSPTFAECLNCGLLQTLNPHPKAGKLGVLNVIGSKYGCLPCAEKRANGRARMLVELKDWLAIQSEENVSLKEIIQKIDELDNLRKKRFHERDPELDS